jgi:hypothetical protein
LEFFLALNDPSVVWRHILSMEGKMPAVVMQFVSHPKPGSDLATILQLAKDGAVLWRKHGADVSYWSVIGGEVGNYAFVARFDSIEAYGRTLASLGADPAFAEFQAARLKAGQSDWVRSNMSIQVDI